MSDDLVFSGELTEVPVMISGKSYTLKEASGEAACIYRNTMLKCTRLGVDGKPSSVDGLADIEPLLVSLCLFDSSGNQVPVKTVRSWPSKVVNRLYTKAKEISELDEEDNSKAKNEQSGIVDG